MCLFGVAQTHLSLRQAWKRRCPAKGLPTFLRTNTFASLMFWVCSRSQSSPSRLLAPNLILTIPGPSPRPECQDWRSVLRPPKPLDPRHQGFGGKLATLLVEGGPRMIDSAIDLCQAPGGHTQTEASCVESHTLDLFWGNLVPKCRKFGLALALLWGDLGRFWGGLDNAALHTMASVRKTCCCLFSIGRCPCMVRKEVSDQPMVGLRCIRGAG